MFNDEVFEVEDVRSYLSIINSLKNRLDNKINNEFSFEIIDFITKDQYGNLNEEKINEYIKLFRLYTFQSMNREIPVIKVNNSRVKKNNKTINKDGEFFYRGVYDGKHFNLLPSCMRKEHYGNESEYIHQMQIRCSADLGNRNHLDTLVTLQHYGCPTRLLDITSNPLVALYFACKNYGKNTSLDNYGYVYVFVEDKDSVLYKDSDKAIMLSCLAKLSIEKQNRIYDECMKKIKTHGINAKFDQNREAQCIEDLYHEIRTEISFEKKIRAIDLLKNYFVIPDYSNRRIEKQNGAFIINGLSKDEDEYLEKINDTYVYKIKILNQKQILQELDIYGINEATLFPEMDKVASYIIDKLKV